MTAYSVYLRSEFNAGLHYIVSTSRKVLKQDPPCLLDFRFLLTVAGQSAPLSVDTYTYESIPFIASVSGCPASTASSPETNQCPTEGGVTITISGGNLVPGMVRVRSHTRLLRESFKRISIALHEIDHLEHIEKMSARTLIVNDPLALLRVKSTVSSTSASGCPESTASSSETNRFRLAT